MEGTRPVERRIHRKKTMLTKEQALKNLKRCATFSERGGEAQYRYHGGNYRDRSRREAAFEDAISNLVGCLGGEVDDAYRVGPKFIVSFWLPENWETNSDDRIREQQREVPTPT